MNRVSVIIPAYKPDEKLIGTLEGLRQVGFTDLLVVDDGMSRPFDDPPIVVNYFFHERIRKSSKNGGA